MTYYLVTKIITGLRTQEDRGVHLPADAAGIVLLFDDPEKAHAFADDPSQVVALVPGDETKAELFQVSLDDLDT